MRRTRRHTLMLLVLCLAAPRASHTDPADVQALTAGVRQLGVAGVPGPLSVFGPRAFGVVAGTAEGRREALVAAARWERGRVVAFGHGGYLDPRREGCGRLLVNAVRWAGAGRAGGAVGVVRNARLLTHLVGQGLTARATTAARPDGLAVLVVDVHGLRSPAHIAGVAAFVRAGGGLVTAGLGWGWQQLNPRQDLVRDFPGNRLLRAAGLVWADGYLRPAKGDRFVVGAAPPERLHAGRALAALGRHARGAERLGTPHVAQALHVLTRACHALPPDARFLGRVDALLATVSGGTPRWPSQARPLGPDRPLDRLRLVRQLARHRRQPADQVTAHPTARIFPGAVADDAPRVGARRTIDAAVPGWHSTGLYAAPGQPITVVVPARRAGQGLSVRIGCHADRVWHKPRWKRSPEITRVFELSRPRTRAACGFGGLVYVVVPRGARPGRVAVTIDGALLAPRYVHGQTDPEVWRREIRKRPAPWGEVGSDRLIVSVPSRVLRGLDHPDQLMALWDRILDLDAELAGRPLRRERPERIVCDAQISAGYMHSGYPIMTWMDQQQNLVDRAHLLKGNWGLFHELGHNHQRRDWTFGGTTEVTCNLFTLYVYDRLCGTPPERHPRSDRAARLKHLRGHLRGETPRDFARWKRSPFLALTMYVQLQQAFGWSAFRRVFAEYRALPAGQRPRTDADRRDQWLIRFSRAVGRDLGPFFEAWGVPTSAAARRAVADLPAWRCPDFDALDRPR